MKTLIKLIILGVITLAVLMTATGIASKLYYQYTLRVNTIEYYNNN